MSDHEINVKVNLDDSEAQKKLNDLTNKERKIDINVDTSDIDQASKKVDGLKNKNIKVDAKVTGKETIDSTAKSLDKATKSASGFGNTIKGFAKFGAYLNIFQTIEQTARKAAESIKEIDDQIVNLQMATGSSYEDIRQLSQEYLTLGKNLGATGTEMLSGADLWLRSGRSMNETTKLLKDSTVLSKVASMDAEKSSEVLTATLNGYQMSADAAEHINDVLSSIDLASASSAEGIGEALTKTASVANNAGLSLEKTAAIIATIKDVTQDSDSSIGNSIKSILSRINQIKAGKFVDEETGEALNDTEKVLNKLGISMRDANGQFMDAETIIDNVAQKWASFDKNAQKAIATAMGGAYQYNRLITMFDNYDKVMNLTNIANNSGGVAETKFEEAYLNSLEAKTKSLQASFESLSTNLISRDVINGVLEATQALVEFLDETNLVKGALAGITAGGALKGFTMLTASITQAAMQMTNFSRAMDLVKAGDLLGKDGLQQLCVLTDGLSKSQLKAVLSSEALSTAQRMQILQATGMSEAQAMATLSTMGLATAEGTATASTTTLSGALKGLWATLMANPIVAVGLAIGAGVAAWSSYNQAIEDSIQKAKDVANAWDESNSSLNEQISKYKELKSQLDSGTLTPNEEYSVRQQILDIQTQITSQYGEQADGVNLVNGALDVQLAKLQQIAAENAKTTLNKNREEYDNVVEQMEKSREYSLRAIGGKYTNDGGVGQDILDIAKEYEDAGLKLEETVDEVTGIDTGTYTITFEGDATQADKTITDFMNRVSDLQDKYEGNESATNIINSSVDSASEALKKNQEILDDYQESYNKFLQMDMLSQGTSEGSVADIYYKYADAISAYNEALASGDSQSIAKARSEFQALDDEVNTLLSQGDNERFSSLFDEVGDSLDEASIKLNDFDEALTGKAGSSNTFKDTADDIKSASDALKELNLDAQQVRDALITDGTQTGEEQILALANAWGLTEDAIESQDESFTQFLSILQEAGIITGQVASTTDTAAASYNTFSSTVSKAAENMSTLQSIMSESVSGAGISADNITAIKEMFDNSSDLDAVLEKTANGYHLNVDALRELQAQQETLTKSDYLSALSDQYELLAENSEKLAKAQFMGEDTSGLEATRQGILDQISSLEDLQYQYEAATSAYQDWINAQSNGNERDMYENIQSGYESVKDLIERGWGGSDEVRTYVDLLSGKDLSTAPVEEVIQAYEDLGNTIGNTGYSILDFFTVDKNGNTTTDGIYNFFDTVRSVLGEEYAKLEDGKYTFNFGEGRDQDVAKALGMDVEAVQSILRAASEAGFEINLDQPVASLEELKTSAQSAQEALSNMQDTSLSDINLDSTSFAEITDDIEKVEDYIQQIDESSLDPEVKTEKLENANAILEYLVQMQNEAGHNSIEISVNAEELEQKIEDAKSALDSFKNDDGTVDLSLDGAQEAVDNFQALLSQKQQLSTPTVMAVDTSQVDGELGDAIAKIQEYQNAVQDLAVQTELKAQGVDIDTSAAQEKVNNLASEIQSINPDIELNIDTSSAASLQASIQSITPEILVKAGVDESAIVNYTPGDKDASVKYKVDSSAVDAWDAPDKTANLTYKITTVGILPGNQNRTLTYNIKTNGNVEVNGTAHSNGSTVKSYHFNNWHGQANASGNWGIKKGGTSLVGELGQEILVRNGHFETIGDNGAEFIQTRPNDIIFNHKQTEELLKNGYVTSRGKLIGGNANANGTAYSSGSGGLGRPSRPSYSTGGSYTSNNKSSNNKNSNKSSSTSSTEKAADAVSEAANDFKEKFDEIEILLDRMDRSLNKLTDSIETYSYDLSKQSAVSDQAMNQIRSNLTTLQQAYDRYIQEANNVGLDESWAEKVRNGKIDIETITDEDLKSKIDDYKTYFEKALSVEDTIADYQSQLLDLATQKLDNIEQYFENRTNYNDEFGYLTDISTLQDALNKLTEELDKQVLAGVIKEGSNEFYSAMSQISDAQQALIEATLKKYQDIIDNLDRISTTLDNSLSLKEARGDKITESDYQRPLEVANEQIDKLYDKREALLKQQGIYDVGSELYDDYADQISDVDDEIYGLLGDIEDLKDKIWEVRWQPFFDGQEAAENLRDEMDQVRDLLDSDAFVDTKGGLTAEGITNIALISSAMNTAKQEIRDYQEAIQKLSEDYENGNISTSEYEDNLQSFLESIRSGVSDVESYRDEIVSLYTEMLEKENDVVQESISKYKDLLDIRKQNDSYSRDIKNQTKDINAIKAEISALQGVLVCPIYFNCWELLRALYNNIAMKYGYMYFI